MGSTFCRVHHCPQQPQMSFLRSAEMQKVTTTQNLYRSVRRSGLRGLGVNCILSAYQVVQRQLYLAHAVILRFAGAR